MGYRLFEHTADLGIHIEAPDLMSLLQDAALGLLAVIIANPSSVQPVLSRNWQIAADQHDYLLFDWLSELLYTFETEHLLFSRFELLWDGQQLAATAHGEPLDRQRHQLEHEVKAITYHALRLEQTAEGWVAEVIVDI